MEIYRSNLEIKPEREEHAGQFLFPTQSSLISTVYQAAIPPKPRVRGSRLSSESKLG
jgi:hypothetical protein